MRNLAVRPLGCRDRANDTDHERTHRTRPPDAAEPTRPTQIPPRRTATVDRSSRPTWLRRLTSDVRFAAPFRLRRDHTSTTVRPRLTPRVQDPLTASDRHRNSLSGPHRSHILLPRNLPHLVSPIPSMHRKVFPTEWPLGPSVPHLGSPIPSMHMHIRPYCARGAAPHPRLALPLSAGRLRSARHDARSWHGHLTVLQS